MTTDTKTCPECLASVPAAARKCQHCASSLDGKKSAGEEMTGLVKLLIVFAGIAAVLIVYFAVAGGIK